MTTRLSCVCSRMGSYACSPKASQRVMNHSPDGFEWGYGGSGPAQLALVILLDLYPDRGKHWAVRHHQHLKFKIIASLPRDGAWQVTAKEIDDALEQNAESAPAGRE